MRGRTQKDYCEDSGACVVNQPIQHCSLGAFETSWGRHLKTNIYDNRLLSCAILKDLRSTLEDITNIVGLPVSRTNNFLKATKMGHGDMMIVRKDG
jgi:hypothetical protein